MTPNEARKYLDKLSLRGINPGLERMHKIMDALDHPEKSFESIHITGSNGKGSTAAMLESVLRHSNVRTGMYTSPHLVDVTERIVISGKPISWRVFADLIGNIKKKSGYLEKSMTYFEMVTAAAFCAFEQARVRIAVLEVGLGGRFDATNVIPAPRIAVITNVSLEHTQYLGNTLQAIAWEKSQIVKEGSICVSGAKGAALKTIRKTCAVKHVSLYIAKEASLTTFQTYKTGLAGDFQRKNLGLVLECVRTLRAKGWEISQSAIHMGLRKVKWPGRFDWRIFKGTPVLLDGAHNPGAVKTLMDALRKTPFAKKPCRLIFNALEDKNVRDMSRLLSSGLRLSGVMVPGLNSTRSSAPEKVSSYFSNILTPKTFPNMKSLWAALTDFPISKQEWILATGSFYVVGESMPALSGKGNS